MEQEKENERKKLIEIQNIQKTNKTQKVDNNLNVNNQEKNILLTESIQSDIEKYSNESFVPKKVNTLIPLPVSKNSSSYKMLKEEIINHIEDGICELEYFNLDYAKEHVETALYYLRNIKD